MIIQPLTLQNSSAPLAESSLSELEIASNIVRNQLTAGGSMAIDNSSFEKSYSDISGGADGGVEPGMKTMSSPMAIFPTTATEKSSLSSESPDDKMMFD
jgi:hypothetical protein